MTRKMTRSVLLVSIVVVMAALGSLPVRAQDTATLYKTKCAACHAADGSGNTVVGKQLQMKAFNDPDVAKMSDADLTMIIVNGKNKMPMYGKTLKPDEVKGLVAYTRELAKK